jgi:predicted phosphodiesterase
MRIALLADIHGNDIALRSVLNDIDRQGGVDEYWVLGDIVAIGHAPIKVLEMLHELSNTKFVRGNTDRYVCAGDRPPPTVEEVEANPSLLTQMIEVEGDFSWTQGAVTTGGWLEWLSNLPLQMSIKLPDGTAALCVHASPNRDGGTGIHPKMSEAEIDTLLRGCHADLICVGHTHQQFRIRAKDKMVINPGSVSNHVGADVRANYGTIDADEVGYRVEFFQVDYNQDKVIGILEAINHPARRFIIQHLRGERG